MNTEQNKVFWWAAYVPHIAVAILAYWLLQHLQPILLPFLIGGAWAYLGDPLVDRLELRGLNRTLSVSLVFLSLSLIGLLAAIIVVPMLITQFEILAERLPRMVSETQAKVVPQLNSLLGSDLQQIDLPTLKAWISNYWQQSRESAMALLWSASRSGGSLLALAANLLLVPVVTFYLLRDWDLIVARIRSLLPRQHEATVVQLSQQADEVLGSFILGQMWVMFGLSVVYSFGLWMVGLDFPMLIGLLAGLVSFVPYLGAVVGIVVAGAAMWLQTGQLLDLALVGGVFAVGQMLESMLLTPWLVGDKIGLHPVAVIFAVLAGGQVFGFIGILLALPVAAVVAVLMRYWLDQYLRSAWYGHVDESAEAPE
jgi:predicted PurR-regulated permease PerM